MGNTSHSDIPKHLLELMQPTPSSVAKLLAAWDGLSVETQILILSNFGKRPFRGYPEHLDRKIRKNALNSENAYVRYLAVQGFPWSYADDSENAREDEAIKTKIANDPVALVKYSQHEYLDAEDADSFFALPHEVRLAQVRSLISDGKKIAKILSQGADKHLKDGTVSELEFSEILTDYVAKPEFCKWYLREETGDISDLDAVWDIEALWGLVPKLPERMSHILINNLPTGAYLHENNLPEEVVESMTEAQLMSLLYRKDVDLRVLRKKLFWETTDEEFSRLKHAATCNAFTVGIDEFAEVLAKPPKEQASLLGYLSRVPLLSLCLYDAVHDALRASPHGDGFDDAMVAHDMLYRTAKEMDKHLLEKELVELRLYRLARQVVPWKPEEEGVSLPHQLEFLSKSVVPNNTWATFMQFSEAWEARNSRWEEDAPVENLEEHLPSVWELEEDSDEQAESNVDRYIAESGESIKDLREKNEILLGSVEQVKQQTAELGVCTQNQAEGFSVELKGLHASLGKQKILLFITIGLVIWLLLK